MTLSLIMNSRDLKKSNHYIEMIIEREYTEENPLDKKNFWGILKK